MLLHVRRTNRIHLIIISHQHFVHLSYEMYEIHPNPKLSTPFLHPFPNHQSLFTHFFVPSTVAWGDQIKIKGHGSRVSSPIHIHETERSRVLSQFEHGLVRATNQFPHADVLERCIEKLVHTVRACTSSLPSFHVPHSVTRFVPRRSRKNTREYSKPTPVSSLSATTSQLFRCHRRW